MIRYFLQFTSIAGGWMAGYTVGEWMRPVPSYDVKSVLLLSVIICVVSFLGLWEHGNE